jgi:hypothetical protein
MVKACFKGVAMQSMYMLLLLLLCPLLFAARRYQQW